MTIGQRLDVSTTPIPRRPHHRDSLAPSPRHTLALIAALALSAAACDSALDPALDPPHNPALDPLLNPALDPTPNLALDPARPAAIPPLTPLTGRLIVASGDDPAPRGVVDAFDPQTGERTRLWDTGPETSAWTMAPNGRLVAYLAAVREPTEIERLIVRAPAPGAEARLISGADASVARFSGFAWSADGETIASVRQIGFPGTRPDPDARWALTVFAVGDGDANAFSANERTVWSATAADIGPVALSLAAWDSAAGRAVVLEAGLDGGPVVALRMIDTLQGEELERRSIDGAGEGFRSSPDGSRLAWIRMDDGAIIVFAPADSTLEKEIPNDADMRRDGLIWSNDARRLAWRQDGPPGAAAETRTVVADLETTDPPIEHALPGRALRPLAFSPDGNHLLLGAGMPNEIETSDLHIINPLGSAPPNPLGWPAPNGRWGLTWIP